MMPRVNAMFYISYIQVYIHVPVTIAYIIIRNIHMYRIGIYHQDDSYYIMFQVPF